VGSSFGGVKAVESSEHKFVNELYGLGGNSTVYRPPREQRSEDVPHDGEYD